MLLEIHLGCERKDLVGPRSWHNDHAVRIRGNNVARLNLHSVAEQRNV